uniref:Ingression protein fic1 n=1 Tax=Anthurium amnicola TaxID=1678845 RepID=A0A1D1YNK7_9ARAE
MTEQKKLGTLVVVAMEARNLSTRDSFGKGDPFVAFHIDGESKRTKPEIKGGQHPKWDEEVRFNVAKNSSKKLKIQVFNEDKREPILIGDALIDLSEVLNKTEWDDWHQINFRNKYAGEVSLEMTFYYDGPPPNNVVKNVQSQKQLTHNNSLPPQPPNSYPSATATHISPPVVSKAPLSAPSGYPPSSVYPPNSSSPYPPASSSNVYPPPSSISPNIYPPNSTSPPQSQPPQFFGPKRTQSPVSSQYPPVSSSGYPPSSGYSSYSSYPPPQQSQGYPPVYPPVSSPPYRHDSSQGANLAFPVPVPTGAGHQPYSPSNNPYPPNYPPNNNPYPPSNIYPPPVSGGNVYPPPNNTFNQGYPPNNYPPNNYPPNNYPPNNYPPRSGPY